jgi:hypothetical protein
MKEALDEIFLSRLNKEETLLPVNSSIILNNNNNVPLG